MAKSLCVNEIQVSYKSHIAHHDMLQVNGSNSAYDILHALWDENRIELVEDFKMLLLNRACKVIGVYHVSSGSTSGTIADPKLIFVAALKTNACNIILAHNHPSGNLNPSEQDKRMTKRLMDAGELLDIKVFDHLIVTNNGYYSFSDGMEFKKVRRSGKNYLEAQPPF